VPIAICLHTVQQSRDAVWNTKSGESNPGNMYYTWECRWPHGKGRFWECGLFSEISAKSGIFETNTPRNFTFFMRNMLCPIDQPFLQQSRSWQIDRQTTLLCLRLYNNRQHLLKFTYAVLWLRT